MRKLQKAAFVGAVLGSVGSLGAGTALAHGEAGAHDTDIGQSTHCRTHDMNIDILGAVGALNGTLGNAANGEGSPGAQPANMGSKMSCDNNAH
ncbi:hypothetical protein [Streptomyces halobius]|uniref:Small secreted domain DUF320 n=1 Tax=Streptomyces halobius TaxID=2879846 RepID=A0ABY4MCJ8_9ACTN|nr:hypothetical protein [Streptomyces halobius]UQA95042.1 hypothetical protein K9S39_27140 [Streptomyces halobius]